MRDSRFRKLAHLLVNYSCEAKAGDKVLIEAIDVPQEFTGELIRATHEAGAIPFIKLDSNAIRRTLLKEGSQESWAFQAEVEGSLMKQVQCYIAVRGNHNVSDLSDISPAKQELYEKTFYQPVHFETRVKKTRWVVLRWPTSAMAQLAEMSTEAFEDFFFNVCTLDYARMERAMQPLVKRMQTADKVHIRGPKDTDLTFSIKDIGARGCSGKRNIPDGEVFSAPVKTSVNGVIHYNTPTIYRGETHLNVRFEFKEGKIINATSNNSDKLNQVLDSDEGARYIGEFAIGFNPFCLKPMKDILFDEKMAGSLHFTPGMAYQECDNGNKSNIHWDLVLRQTAEMGGGEIYFDDVLIRKDGLFVIDDLKPLNPEFLQGLEAT